MTVFSEIDSKEHNLICAATWYKLENMSDAEKNEILFDIIKDEYERESIFHDIVNRIISDVGENNFEEVAEEASCDEQETNLLIYLTDLQTFKENHDWIIDDIFDAATEHLPLDKFEEYYNDYQGFSSTYSNDAVNVFLDVFPIEELPHFDSYYQGLYDDLEEFYKEMDEMKESDPDCDYNKEDYVIHDGYVFDTEPVLAGPYV